MALEVCRGHRYRAAVSARVLLEARVNIAEKFRDEELVRFYQQMAALDPEMAPRPTMEALARCASIVGEKDAHVLAAALCCGAGHLLTLDRRHLITSAVKSADLPLAVATPGEFLREISGR